MKIYQVGGCVRDQLLGRPSTDRDWVVVGSNPQEMLSLGFVQVGADFPVFLHPQTQEEYALARLERKEGQGYLGFTTQTNGVTLEEDLSRRDLTINAMALDQDGTLVDPYGGERDIRDKLLRHVGPAFSEDPVRVLRVLRFQASLGPEWRIASQTWALMQQMADSGQLKHLVPERVWRELAKVMVAQCPQRFLQGFFDLGMHKMPGMEPFEALSPQSIELAGEPFFRRMTDEAKLVSAFSIERSFTAAAPRPAPGMPGVVHGLARLLSRWSHMVPRSAREWAEFFNQAGAYRAGSHVGAALEVWKLQGHLVMHGYAALAAACSVDTKAITASMPPGPAVGQAVAQARLKAIEDRFDVLVRADRPWAVTTCRVVSASEPWAEAPSRLP